MRSWHQRRPQPVKDFLQLLQPGRLLQRPDHLQAERRAEPEGAFKHAPVEAGDDEDRILKPFVGEEAKQFDPVHAGHAKVERHHLRPFLAKTVAELLVLLGDHRVEAAQVGRPGHERGQRRLIVDQQQPRQRHSASLKPPFPRARRFTTIFRASVKRVKPDFNPNTPIVPL